MAPTKVNYIFGANGSGKSSLAKLVYDPQNLSDCSVEFDKVPLPRLVYNRKFVAENFRQSNEVKGTFTLGKDAKEAQDLIANIKQQIEKINNDLGSIDQGFKRANEQERDAKDIITKKAWSIKT